ncbi:MAG: hypothetical protein ACE5QW_07130 [Thermoplasmata archaeon]
MSIQWSCRTAWELTPYALVRKGKKLEPLSNKKLREMSASLAGADWENKIKGIISSYREADRKPHLNRFGKELLRRCQGKSEKEIRDVFRYLLWNVGYVAGTPSKNAEQRVQCALLAEGFDDMVTGISDLFGSIPPLRGKKRRVESIREKGVRKEKRPWEDLKREYKRKRR